MTQPKVHFCEDCENRSKIPFMDARCSRLVEIHNGYVQRAYERHRAKCSDRRDKPTCSDFKQRTYSYDYY